MGKHCEHSHLLSWEQVHVSAAPNRLDAFLVAIIRPDLAPQIADVHVDAAVHRRHGPSQGRLGQVFAADDFSRTAASTRSEEHTSELQSRQYLVCRLLLGKKN